MAKLKGTLRTGPNLQGNLTTGRNIQAKALNVGGVIGKLADLSDIDAVDLGDGAMLIYNESSGKFEIRREIQNPNTKIIGGSF